MNVCIQIVLTGEDVSLTSSCAFFKATFQCPYPGPNVSAAPQGLAIPLYIHLINFRHTLYILSYYVHFFHKIALFIASSQCFYSDWYRTARYLWRQRMFCYFQCWCSAVTHQSAYMSRYNVKILSFPIVNCNPSKLPAVPLISPGELFLDLSLWSRH